MLLGSSTQNPQLQTNGRLTVVRVQAAGLVQQSRSQGGQDRAVLTCGTGMGMAIVANKLPYVYAAVVESVGAAGNAAAINNANVLTMGGNIWKVSARKHNAGSKAH